MSDIQPRLQSMTRDDPRWIKLAMRSGALILALILITLFTPWVQTAPGEGRVIAFQVDERLQELTSPIEARIQNWLVNEGSFVKAGDPIVELSDNDPMILERLRKERDAVKKRLKASQVAKKTAEINVDRQNDLFHKGLSAQRTVELSQIEFARYESEEASALAELARIDVRLARQEQQKITAPIDGTVIRILKTSSGGTQYVKAGEPLATILPNTDSRSVEMWIRGNDLPWIKLGQEVRLQFQGWPAIQFSGWPDLALGTFKGKVILIDSAGDMNGNFRLVIQPEAGSSWPTSAQLRQGVRVMGWVLLGRVTVAYELWRQFNGFPPGIITESQKSDDEKSKLKK